MLPSLLKSTRVPFSFPLLVLVLSVIFLEKELCEGSEMLLEPHQNSEGKGRLDSWPLNLGKKLNKSVIMSALQCKQTGLAVDIMARRDRGELC